MVFDVSFMSDEELVAMLDQLKDSSEESDWEMVKSVVAEIKSRNGVKT